MSAPNNDRRHTEAMIDHAYRTFFIDRAKAFLIAFSILCAWYLLTHVWPQPMINWFREPFSLWFVSVPKWLFIAIGFIGAQLAVWTTGR